MGEASSVTSGAKARGGVAGLILATGGGGGDFCSSFAPPCSIPPDGMTCSSLGERGGEGLVKM